MNHPRRYAPVIPIVQKQQSKSTYTVSVIGGHADLMKWRAEQLAKEEQWQKAQVHKRALRVDAALEIMRGLKPAKLTELEKAELIYRGKRNPNVKLVRSTEVALMAFRPSTKFAKPPFMRCVRNILYAWAAKLWRNAFDSQS